MNEFDGVQGRPHQDVPLWHVDYFELKAIEKKQTHGSWSIPQRAEQFLVIGHGT